MVADARAVIKMNPDPKFRDSFKTLEEFSHIWVVFVFHHHVDQEWRSTITPPRLDVGSKVGVFASRSPHRPNSIGLSAVKLEKIDLDAVDGVEIHISGVDLLDGTPVLDLKPYVPYVDRIADAKGGWTETEIPRFKVEFSVEALQQIRTQGADPLVIEQMLALDPRPTPQRKTMPISDPVNEGRRFAFRVFDFDVKWEIRESGIYVHEILILE